jgi:hypothetical protein
MPKSKWRPRYLNDKSITVTVLPSGFLARPCYIYIYIMEGVRVSRYAEVGYTKVWMVLGWKWQPHDHSKYGVYLCCHLWVWWAINWLGEQPNRLAIITATVQCIFQLSECIHHLKFDITVWDIIKFYCDEIFHDSVHSDYNNWYLSFDNYLDCVL